jgi:hypothetical protein
MVAQCHGFDFLIRVGRGGSLLFAAPERKTQGEE